MKKVRNSSASSPDWGAELLPKIKEAKADYMLPVKDNHKVLKEGIELMFKDAVEKKFIGIDADHYETLAIRAWKNREKNILCY